MTGEDWIYIRDVATGRIKGVRSRAKLTAIKQHKFPPAVFHFEGLTQYHDWVFQYAPASTPQEPQAADKVNRRRKQRDKYGRQVNSAR